MNHRGLARARQLPWLGFIACYALACAQEAPLHTRVDDRMLSREAEFLSVTKPQKVRGDALVPAADDGDFYVAIRKDLLASRWFLTGQMQQFHPFGPTRESGKAALAFLGTRVVSFR